MKSRDELAREVEVPGERIATLSAAVLRLGSSLDLATVLQEAPTAPARSPARAARAGRPQGPHRDHTGRRPCGSTPLGLPSHDKSG